MGSILGLGRSGGGNGNPLQYSCLENPMDRGAWRDTVHGVTKSQTQLQWLSTHTHTGSLLPHVGSNSLARDQTQAPCIGSPESWPLDHLPALNFLKAPSNKHLELKIPGLIWRDPLCNRLDSSRNTILYSLKHFFSEILQASWYLILMFF